MHVLRYLLFQHVLLFTTKKKKKNLSNLIFCIQKVFRVKKIINSSYCPLIIKGHLKTTFEKQERRNVPFHLFVSSEANDNQNDDDDDDDQDDGDHPGEDLAVGVILGTGADVVVQFVVTDIGVHARVTQALVDVRLTIFPLVASSAIALVVVIEAVSSMGVFTREYAGG